MHSENPWPKAIPTPSAKQERIREDEIGAALGEHLAFEPRGEESWWALKRQRQLPLAPASFDRALAIHVLEHLPDLPSAVAELRRVLGPSGRLVPVIPYEGGLA